MEEAFLLKLTNTHLRKKFLGVKDFEERVNAASHIPTVRKEALKAEQKLKLIEYQDTLEYFFREFNICVDEGINKARYRPKSRVYYYCANKTYNFILEHDK